MAAEKKKPDLSVVIGSIAKPKGEPDGDEEMPAEGDAYQDAMSEMGDAIASKDWAKASEAFKALHSLCSADEKSSEAGEEAAEGGEY